MTHENYAIKAVRAIDRVTDLMIEIILCVVLLLGVYSLWDSNQIYSTADSKNYEVYKPGEDPLNFEELRRINPEVFAWITVNDTPIDYPVTQTSNNEKYINTNAEGNYTLTGSIFLDYRNSPDFDDFNSIIYGHHMEKKLMFGSLSDFEDSAYFESHPYGNLYFNGRDHGLEFFAFILTDAYDSVLFSSAVKGETRRQNYLDRILSTAIYTRDINVSTSDQIIVLSTCTSAITNGRYMLVAKLSEELHIQERVENTKIINLGKGIDARQVGILAGYPVWLWILVEIVLVTGLILIERKKRKYLQTNKRKLQT